jgi:hypothetical protein
VGGQTTPGYEGPRCRARAPRAGGEGLLLRGCWQCGADVCVSVQIDSSSSFLSTHATNQISVGAHGGAQKDHQYTFDHVMGTGATQQDVYGASRVSTCRPVG